MSRTSSPPDNEAIHDLRDELKDLNKTIKESGKTTERYTVVLMTFAMIQIIVALVAVGINLVVVPEKYHYIVNLGWGILLILAIYRIFKFGDELFDLRNLWEKDKN